MTRKKETKHVTEEFVRSEFDRVSNESDVPIEGVHFLLHDGETAWDPNHKRPVKGPADLVYRPEGKKFVLEEA